MSPKRAGGRWWTAASVAVLAAVALAPAPRIGSSARASEAEFCTDFEDGTVGTLPPRFYTGLTGKGRPVAWVLHEDPTAPAGPKVLAETSGDRTSDRFPLAILDGFEAKDVEVTVRFKPVAGEVDQAAGLVVRLQDENNYYIARANALEGNVRLYKVVDGKRRQFAGVDVEVPASEWQELGLRAEGGRLTVSLDGKELFGATDRTFAKAGKVGLWTKADSITHFDELIVRRSGEN